jgi:hypothetical protein
MSWTSAEEVRKKIERRWKRGEILRALIGLESPFPLRLSLSVPSPREMALEFGRAQEWIVSLRALSGTRLEWRSVRSQILGQQEIPAAVWIDRAEEAVLFLEVQDDAKCFRALQAVTAALVPEVLPWLGANPFRVIALNADWGLILQVVAWMKTRPAQKIYTRQIDLPGVDTKFIELHAGVLAELFELVTDRSIEEMPTELTDFHAKFGFLREPPRVRFRVLDPAIRFAFLPNKPDVELDAESFAALQLPLKCVFVTENKTNFLAFPEFDGSIVVFGSGYGMRAFGLAQWVHRLPLYYWGDIDTHGFAILSELRTVFPHAQSFLMDRETLFNHQNSWTRELAPVKHSLKLLNPDEMALFMELQSGIPHEGIRLEQEKVPFSRLKSILDYLRENESLATIRTS